MWCTVGGNTNWWSHSGEQYGDLLKSRTKTTIWLSNATTGYIAWGNYKQDEKTTLRMGENNSKWNNWQGANLQNIEATHAAQYQKSKQPN